uniref:Uncharacterized protein n=1 Tax=Oryza nivara TaxID=4536 RepID=A0A0E0HZB5_ORYNI
MSTCLIKTLALKNILDQHVVVCAWKFKIRCAMSKLWERNLKKMRQSNSISLCVPAYEIVKMEPQEKNSQSTSLGASMEETIVVCKNIFKMNGTLPHWGCNGIKDSDDQWLNSDS